MSPLNAAICTTISYTLWVEWYYLKNNYLTLRSKVKVPRHIALWSCTHIPNIIDLSRKTRKYQRLSRACIVHLVIKKNNYSYVKTMSCSGSHLGITINIKNTKFVKDLPMIDAQFRFNQCNSFREEYISVFSPYGSVLILWPVVAAILDFRSA